MGLNKHQELAIVRLMTISFKSEPTLCANKQSKSDILIISLYVDDLVFYRNNNNIMAEQKNEAVRKY